LKSSSHCYGSPGRWHPESNERPYAPLLQFWATPLEKIEVFRMIKEYVKCEISDFLMDVRARVGVKDLKIKDKDKH